MVQRHATRRVRALQILVLAVVGALLVASLVLNCAPAFIPTSRTPWTGAGVAGRRGVTALRAEDEKGDGGFLKFLKVEQDIELSPEEYKLALEQEIESERKKYYIGGVVRPNNLIVPWKPVEEKELEKDARRQLKKNGIIDPDGEQRAADDGDSGLTANLVGEQDVKLEWTAGEPGTRVGYIVERKRAMDSNYEELATYEDQDSPYLLAMPYAGHEYSYDDRMIPPGAYAYRILLRDRSGQINVIDQKEITVPELSGIDNLYALGILVTVFLSTVLYGTLVDPELS